MDISSSAFSAAGYYSCVNHIYTAVSAVVETVFKKAAQEEQQENKKKKDYPKIRLLFPGMDHGLKGDLRLYSV